MASSQRALYIGFVGGGFNTSFHIHSLLYVRNCYVAGVTSGSTGMFFLKTIESFKGIFIFHYLVYFLQIQNLLNVVWSLQKNYASEIQKFMQLSKKWQQVKKLTPFGSVVPITYALK
jgi:hypothetical protein